MQKRLQGLGASLPKSTIKKATCQNSPAGVEIHSYQGGVWLVMDLTIIDCSAADRRPDEAWRAHDRSLLAPRRTQKELTEMFLLIRMFSIPWKCDWPVVLLLPRISQAFLNPVNPEELVNVTQSACSVWGISNSSNCTDVSPCSLQNCWNGL